MVSRHILTSSISASAHTSYSLKTPDLNVGLAYICSTWRSYLLHLKIAWFAPLSRCTALDSLNRGHFVPATWPNIRYHHLHQELVWDTGRVWWERIANNFLVLAWWGRGFDHLASLTNFNLMSRLQLDTSWQVQLMQLSCQVRFPD